MKPAFLPGAYSELVFDATANIDPSEIPPDLLRAEELADITFGHTLEAVPPPNESLSKQLIETNKNLRGTSHDSNTDTTLLMLAMMMK